MRALRYAAGFLLGATAGFILAASVAAIIGWIEPYEHALRGFVGVLLCFIAMPTLGVMTALWLGRPAPRGGPPEARGDSRLDA